MAYSLGKYSEGNRGRRRNKGVALRRVWAARGRTEEGGGRGGGMAGVTGVSK